MKSDEKPLLLAEISEGLNNDGRTLRARCQTVQ